MLWKSRVGKNDALERWKLSKLRLCIRFALSLDAVKVHKNLLLLVFGSSHDESSVVRVCVCLCVAPLSIVCRLVSCIEVTPSALCPWQADASVCLYVCEEYKKNWGKHQLGPHRDVIGRGRQVIREREREHQRKRQTTQKAIKTKRGKSWSWDRAVMAGNRCCS